MAKDYLEDIGYYFWLVPSVISAALSGVLLILRVTNWKKMKFIAFGEAIFAVADLLQCVPWFFGSIYSTTTDRSESKLCLAQERTFKVGVLVKCLMSSIGTAILAHQTVTKLPLRLSKIFVPISVLVMYTIATLLTNLFLHGDYVACHNLHNFDINHIKDYEIVYVVCFLIPIFLFCFMNFLSFSWAMYSSTASDPTMVTAMMTPHHDRIIAFTLITWVAYIPALLFYLFWLFNEVNIPLYCITGLMVSSTGMLGSGYLILSPLIDKSRRVNLFFYIERLLEENGDEDTVDGMKLSEIR